MPFTINEVIDLCRRKNVQVDLVNFTVGSLMIDKTGVCGRGSAVTFVGVGDVPPIQPDEVIAEAAQTFIIRPAEGEPFLLNREEFEQYLRE